MGISQFQEVRVPSFGGDAGNNALREHGLSFDVLNLLNEHGLVIADYNSWRDVLPCVALPGLEERAVCITFTYQRKHWVLVPNERGAVGKRLRINGVALTNSGRKLSEIVETKQVFKYSQELAGFLEKNGFRMIEVFDAQPLIIDTN